MKKLSIFDLQEGKVYAAFDGDRRLGKNYRVTDGKLQNASKDEDPNDLNVYEGCTWVPLKASITFKEVFTAQEPVNILKLKHGLVYKASAQINGFLARTGNTLIQLNSDLKPVGPVNLAIVNLNTMFTAVAEITAEDLAPKMPKKAKKIVKTLVASKRKATGSKRSSARR